MKAASGASGPWLSISATERDTGLRKETLRMWERRYGFPNPHRDQRGERAYPIEQVDKLRVLKRLLDAGHRPGRIVHLDADELNRLADPVPGRAAAPCADMPAVQRCLGLLVEHDLQGLRSRLGALLATEGLGPFVTDIAAPLCTQVGDAWMRGQLEIYQEHLCTEQLQGVLREGIRRLPEPAAEARPRVLLGTVAGESHGLGLLMAEAMLAQEGARCASLGVQTPLWELVLAARATRADIVALSFTGGMGPGQVTEAVAELREKLPAATELWAGGSAPVLQRRPTAGVLAMATLMRIPAEIARWRRQQGQSDA
jgi:MerR family transcriptional regulator, light-induced transcriptional regulator